MENIEFSIPKLSCIKQVEYLHHDERLEHKRVQNALFSWRVNQNSTVKGIVGKLSQASIFTVLVLFSPVFGDEEWGQTNANIKAEDVCTFEKNDQ